jgi:CTP synthase (UTP-ammonia lyase)
VLSIIGEFNPSFEPHAATDAALAHSSAALGLGCPWQWVSTADLDDTLPADCRGLLIAPGSPYKHMGKTLNIIRFARENGVPCLGTCGGFQHMVIEYTRNVLGFRDAQHAEYDPYASDLFVTELACSLAGREMELRFEPGSLVARCYGALSAVERYYCNFGVHPDRVAALAEGPLRIVGSDAEGAVRVVELPGHPFFVGTLFVPQSRSRADAPHPLINAFLRAVAGKAPGNRPARSQSKT